MPQGVNPKKAINNVLGNYLKKNGFKSYKDFPPELYSYKRNIDNSEQMLTFEFNWTPSFIIKEGEALRRSFPLSCDKRWKSYKHDFVVGVNERSLYNIIFFKKYSHILVDREKDDYLEKAEYVDKNDPLLNRWFLTQEELEEKLALVPQALEEYGFPYLKELSMNETKKGDEL